MLLIDRDALLLLAQRKRDGILTQFDIENFPVMKLKIVLCKECKHSRTPGNTSIRYGLPGTVTCANPNSPCHYRHTKGEDYCPYGVKKDDN
jgi:hypothetical protein